MHYRRAVGAGDLRLARAAPAGASGYTGHMSDNALAGQMATLAAELLGTLTGDQRAAAA